VKTFIFTGLVLFFMAFVQRRPTVPPTAVAASPTPSGRILKSQTSDPSLENNKKSRTGMYKSSHRLHAIRDNEPPSAFQEGNGPVINISGRRNTSASSAPPSSYPRENDDTLADELDYITINTPTDGPNNAVSMVRSDKAARILGIRHRKSMEPVPASARNSIMSTRSLRENPPVLSHIPSLPLTSLYVVSGLPKSPHTWTLADPDSVLGLHHSESAVNRWWRPEVLGSTVSPGAGGGKKKKGRKGEEILKGAGALSKQEVGKMLSKALKVRTVKSHSVIASDYFP
jgi:nicotinamide N-methyltransferase